MLMRVLMLMQMLILMLMLVRSEVGGSESSVSTPPNWEIDFGFGCDCVACVRAKLRARDDSSVAGAGRANLWGSGPVRSTSDFE